MSKQKRKFIVCGRKPAVSNEHNKLMQAFDLGLTGAYVKFAENVTMTINEDVTPAQLEQHPIALKAAYEAQGCIDTVVVEYD